MLENSLGRPIRRMIQIFISDIKGNKTDRDDREIPYEVGEEFAHRNAMFFLETSAKASDNVERLFSEIAYDLLQVYIQTIS